MTMKMRGFSLLELIVVIAIIVMQTLFDGGLLERTAQAEPNTLAIMYFENVSDPEDTNRFAHMITSLLITDLSGSGTMRVVSRQRLYDILKALGKQDLKVIDKTVASEVAEKAGVKWILTGDILRTDPAIVLTSERSIRSCTR